MVQSTEQQTTKPYNKTAKYSPPPTELEMFRLKNKSESRVQKFLKYEKEKEKRALSLLKNESSLQIPIKSFQNNYFVWYLPSIKKQSPVNEREKKSIRKREDKLLSQKTCNVNSKSHQIQHLQLPTANFKLQLFLSDEAIEELRDYPFKK